jgi:hypothetical protein
LTSRALQYRGRRGADVIPYYPMFATTPVSFCRWFYVVFARGGAFRAFGAVLMYTYVAVSALFFSFFLFVSLWFFLSSFELFFLF